MGYSIWIGNAVLEADFNDPAGPRACWVVEDKTLEDAPRFLAFGRSNVRMPSYTTMATFAGKLGLRDFFFDREVGLMPDGFSGTKRLLARHADRLTETLQRYREQHPKSIPDTCGCSSCCLGPDGKGKHNPNADDDLARLLWFQWWTQWAVRHCERPAIYVYG